MKRLRRIVVYQTCMGGTVKGILSGGGVTVRCPRCTPGCGSRRRQGCSARCSWAAACSNPSRNRVGFVRPLCNHVGRALQEAEVHPRHVLAEYAQDEELNAREDCYD